MNNFIGEIAALSTALLWSLTSIFFTIAGRRVGAWAVNMTRLLLALVLLLGIHLATIGTLLPWQAEPYRWGWLAVSGVIGLALGDAALFQALVHIGPRLSTLLMAMTPIISTFVAWVFLGEHLAFYDLLAVPITTLGVVWVVLERGNGVSAVLPGSNFRLGVLYGLGGALAVCRINKYDCG